MNNQNRSMMDEYDLKQIEDLSYEYGRLMDWFNETYPESTIRLEVNNDRIKGKLNYTLTTMSGKEMTKDQRLLQNTISITQENFQDLIYMNKLKSCLFEGYKKSITKAFNEQYQKEKSIDL